MIRLGDHFDLDEMTRTEKDWDNTPANIHLVELTRLVALILDPLRRVVGRLDVTSAYRCEVVNREVGGKLRSYHVLGCAADVMSDEFTPEQLMAKVHELNLPYDKMIAEKKDGVAWLHIQQAPAGKVNRGLQYLAEFKNGKMNYISHTA